MTVQWGDLVDYWPRRPCLARSMQSAPCHIRLRYACSNTCREPHIQYACMVMSSVLYTHFHSNHDRSIRSFRLLLNTSPIVCRDFAYVLVTREFDTRFQNEQWTLVQCTSIQWVSDWVISHSGLDFSEYFRPGNLMFRGILSRDLSSDKIR